MMDPAGKIRRGASREPMGDGDAGLDAAEAADIRGGAEFLKHANREIAEIGLTPSPSELRRTGSRMMVAMPVLALKEMHRG